MTILNEHYSICVASTEKNCLTVLASILPMERMEVRKAIIFRRFEIAFGEAQKYEVNDRGWLDKPLHLFKEEEIKYLFVDNADRLIIIPGFKAEDGGSGIASLFRSDSFLN